MKDLTKDCHQPFKNDGTVKKYKLILTYSLNDVSILYHDDSQILINTANQMKQVFNDMTYEIKENK